MVSCGFILGITPISVAIRLTYAYGVIIIADNSLYGLLRSIPDEEGIETVKLERVPEAKFCSLRSIPDEEGIETRRKSFAESSIIAKIKKHP